MIGIITDTKTYFRKRRDESLLHDLEECLILSRYQLSSCVRQILEDGINTGGTGKTKSIRREAVGRKDRGRAEREEEKENDEENEGKVLVLRAMRQLQNCKN